MIDVKQAVKTAMGFVQELYANNIPHNLLLEEVQLSEDEKYWLITVGFSRDAGWGTLAGNNGGERAYKTVKIHAETGEPKEMTIRIP